MTPFWRRLLPRRKWDEELESHMGMRSEWNQSNLGLSPELSAELANRQFGRKLRIRESIEDLYPGRVLADFSQDLQHAFRLFRSSPVLALMVIATVAGGIAAATTIFSIVDPLLFRSLPFRNDQQLVSVGVYAPIDTNEFAMGRMYIDWRDHQTVFSSVTAMRPGTQCDFQVSQTERVPCAVVEQNFLTTLGVAPVDWPQLYSRRGPTQCSASNPHLAPELASRFRIGAGRCWQNRENRQRTGAHRRCSSLELCLAARR